MSEINLVLDSAPVTSSGLTAVEDEELDKKVDELLTKVEDGLTEEEIKQVEEFSTKIDVSNSDIILNYGATAQRNSASLATRTLENVKTKDVGGATELLVQMVSAISGASGNNDHEGVFANFFKKIKRSGQEYLVKQQDVEKTLENIEKQLEGYILKLRADITMVNGLADENWGIIKTLTLYIKAAEIAVDKARTGELAELYKKAKASGKPEDAIKADEFAKRINQLEKRIADLRLTRTSCLQSAPELSMLRTNDEDLSMKLQSSIINTMPLWRKKIAMSIAIKNNLEAAEAANAVDDMTNRMLREQAVQFHQGVIESSEAINRQMIDTDTIEFVNNEIVGAVTDYIEIEQRGIEERRRAVGIIAQSEHNLVKGVLGAVTQSVHGSALQSSANA